MRKGFILTLTALVTALMVTSAVALGPVVGAVPDVYIGPQSAGTPNTELFSNMFRYSGALTLWDYVTAGVTTGDGSSSDTLYQAWAAKDASFSGGTGSYLDPSSIHYSIIQENDVEALLLQPTIEVGLSGWVAEINNALNAEGGSLADYALDQAGALTFRNIRLSPPPDQNYAGPPTATSGLPAGILDLQEATLYVSDTNTTPGTANILLVTTETGQDTLSGGVAFDLVKDYSSDTGEFSSYGLASLQSDTYPVINPGNITLTKTASSITVGTPPTNSPTGYYMYAQWTAPGAGFPVDSDHFYKTQADVSTSNGAASANPSIFLGMNGRVGNGVAGYGINQLNQGAASGPTSSATKTMSGFMAPVKTGTPDVFLGVLDSSDTVGGTVVFTNVKVESLSKASVLAAASPIGSTLTNFTVAAASTTTDWAFLSAGVGTSVPTMTFTPAVGASAAELVLSAQTSTTDPNNIGYASFQGPLNTFPTTQGKLVVIRAQLYTSSGPTAKIPTVWLNAELTDSQAHMLIQRDNTVAGSGPTTTPTDYYLLLEATEATAPHFNLRILADTTSINGDIRMTEVQAWDLDMPSEP